MAKSYTPFRRNTGERNPSVAIGSFAATAILFLALPLTQLIDNPGPPPDLSTQEDFALAVPEFDIMEPPPPPVKIEPDKPQLDDDAAFDPIPLVDIGAIIDGAGNGTGWGPKSSLRDIDFDRIIETYNPIDLDQVPVPVHRVAPTYPYDLKSAGIEGTVSLVFIVDEKGRVREVRVEGASHRGFVQSSVDAVLQWKFEPGRLGDRLVRTRMMIPLQFKIR